MIQLREICTTSLAKWGFNKVVHKEVVVFSTCFLEEELKKIIIKSNNYPKFNLQRNLFNLHFKTSTMEIKLKSLIIEWEFVKNAKEKEVKMLSNVKTVMDREFLCKCIKWDLECISKSKKNVINVKVRDRL